MISWPSPPLSCWVQQPLSLIGRWLLIPATGLNQSTSVFSPSQSSTRQTTPDWTTQRLSSMPSSVIGWFLLIVSYGAPPSPPIDKSGMFVNGNVAIAYGRFLWLGNTYLFVKVGGDCFLSLVLYWYRLRLAYMEMHELAEFIVLKRWKMETAANMEMFILLSAASRHNNVAAHAGKSWIAVSRRPFLRKFTSVSGKCVTVPRYNSKTTDWTQLKYFGFELGVICQRDRKLKQLQ